jgi:hypothetical protein
MAVIFHYDIFFETVLTLGDQSFALHHLCA